MKFRIYGTHILHVHTTLVNNLLKHIGLHNYYMTLYVSHNYCSTCIPRTLVIHICSAYISHGYLQRWRSHGCTCLLFPGLSSLLSSWSRTLRKWHSLACQEIYIPRKRVIFLQKFYTYNNSGADSENLHGRWLTGWLPIVNHTGAKRVAG